MDSRLSHFQLGYLLFQAKTPQDIDFLIKEYETDPKIYDNGISLLRSFVNKDSLDNVRQLLINSADPNIRDKEGETPIFAVKSVAMLELLVSHGALLTIKDYDENTPAHILRKVDDEKILQAFEKLGCDMNSKNDLGMTPFQIRERAQQDSNKKKGTTRLWA